MICVRIWQVSDTHAYICNIVFWCFCDPRYLAGAPPIAVSQGQFAAGSGSTEQLGTPKGEKKTHSVASSPAPSYWQDAQSVHDCDINFGTPATKRDDSPGVESTLPAAGDSVETPGNVEMGPPPAKAPMKKDATFWKRLGYHSLGSILYVQIFKSHTFLIWHMHRSPFEFPFVYPHLHSFRGPSVCWLRMRRYCVPKPGGEVKCSSEVLRLWKNDSILSNQVSNKHAVPTISNLLLSSPTWIVTISTVVPYCALRCKAARGLVEVRWKLELGGNHSQALELKGQIGEQGWSMDHQAPTQRNSPLVKDWAPVFDGVSKLYMCVCGFRMIYTIKGLYVTRS